MKRFTAIVSSFLLLTIACTIPACKKSDPAPADPAKILEGKSWRITAVTVAPAFNGQTDVYDATYDACEQDDLYKFNAGGIFVLDNAAIKCDVSDPQTTPGTWAYDNNTKILRITFNPPQVSYDILYYLSEINDNSFKGEILIPDGGIDYIYTTAFQKQ